MTVLSLIRQTTNITVTTLRKVEKNIIYKYTLSLGKSTENIFRIKKLHKCQDEDKYTEINHMHTYQKKLLKLED